MELPHCCSNAKSLIFSQTKNDVFSAFTFLRDVSAHKNSVSMYHASQSNGTKEFLQSSFRSSHTEVRCIFVTVAVGMVGGLAYACSCYTGKISLLLQGMDM